MGDINVVQGFIDFNWAWDVKGCQLQTTCFNLERGLSHGVGAKPLVALFSMEVKCHSLNEGSKEATWLQAPLSEIVMTENSTTIILCDNQSCIKIVKNPMFHARIKHLKIQYHFAKEKNVFGKINFEHVRLKNQLANIFI